MFAEKFYCILIFFLNVKYSCRRICTLKGGTVVPSILQQEQQGHSLKRGWVSLKGHIFKMSFKGKGPKSKR